MIAPYVVDRHFLFITWFYYNTATINKAWKVRSIFCPWLEIRASTADTYYDVIPSEKLNRSMYETPKKGWPK